MSVGNTAMRSSRAHVSPLDMPWHIPDVRSSTSVRVSGRVARRRRCGQRAAGARTDSASSHRRAHRHLPSRYTRASRRVRRRAASRCRRRRRPDEGGRETLIQLNRGARLLRDTTHFGGRVAANRSRLPPLDPARDAGARPGHALFAPAFIATFRSAAPARCGAFVGKRRFVAGETDEGSSSPAATRRSQRRPSSPRVGPP
jgi:hypothetical protein